MAVNVKQLLNIALWGMAFKTGGSYGAIKRLYHLL
jgi:hypothetical protein